MVPGLVRRLLLNALNSVESAAARYRYEQSRMSRFFPAIGGSTAPQMEIAGGFGRISQQEIGGQSSDSILPDFSTLLFAVPKKKVSKSRRRMRTNNPMNKMKKDESIYQCPKCRAYKKRHLLLHCPREAHDCGLEHDKHMVFGLDRPANVISAPSQGQTWDYTDWESVIGAGRDERAEN